MRTELKQKTSARRAAILQLVNARGSVSAPEVFKHLVEQGLEVPGAPARRRVGAFIRIMLRRGEIPAESIVFQDQSIPFHSLDSHIVRIARKYQPISMAKIARKLGEENLLPTAVRNPTAIVNRYVSRLLRCGTIKPDWIANGRASEKLDRLREALPALVEALQPINPRGVFYQCVARGLISKEEEDNRRVGNVLVELRENGTIPYEWITDTRRRIREIETYESAKEGLEALATGWYRRSLWTGKLERLQIWIEKAGLGGVIEDVCAEYHVPLLASGGFSSLTLCNDAAKLINKHDGPTHIYYFGDHDPSGVDIDRHVKEKLAGLVIDTRAVTFERIALTPAQVKNFRLPTRLTNKNDNRTAAFVAKFGDSATDLDALDPQTLRDLVEEVIRKHISEADVKRANKATVQDTKHLLALADQLS